MASKTEGIALLSMYNDEDDDDEVPEPEQHQPSKRDDIGDQIEEMPTSNIISPQIPETAPTDLSSPSPAHSDEPVDFKTPRSPTPPPFRPPSSDRAMHVTELVAVHRARMETLAMVDYGHDDVDMSPEAQEEGEVQFSGRVMFGSEAQATDGNIGERTPPGTVQTATSVTQSDLPQPSEFEEQSNSVSNMAIDPAGIATEVIQDELTAVVSEDAHEDDPLINFLPPMMKKCPENLQEKINKFLAYKRAGKSFNADLRNRKDYRNPDFLQHAVRYQDIDQIGSCFSKDVFDPHGYDKSDYYDEIEADMKREIERKEQERKMTQKLDFVSGGTQPVAPALKINTQTPGVPVAVTTGLQSVSAAVDVVARDARSNKKSKWDKVDGDVKNHSHSGGNDTISVAGVHTAQLSSGNAGSGYTAFAQQKRREAEERRSGERKFDKRSS